MPDVLKTVGRYEILREVGRGGMAMVYLARQTDLDRFVALKELAAFHASDASFAQRFLRESRVAGSLSHPNIVTVHDYFEHDGTPYIAMEYVERGSLRPFVGHMSLAQIGGVLEGLLAGLAQAEQHGIVHRDLKPENLMVTSEGRVKIADFGIAKATNQMQTGAFLTATGTTVGTPTYMAPEQAMAQDIGPWTDLYSVGCMAFEMFTGKVPFHDSDAPMAILLRHVNEEIAPVKSIDPTVDQGISDWIEQLLIKDPKERTQSANEAWDEFEELIIGLLGPRWRRSARLSARAEQVDTPKPLTPAPFEGTSAGEAPSDEFQSFAWGQPVSETPPGGTAAPPGPATPPPDRRAGRPARARPDRRPDRAAHAPAARGRAESGFVTFGAPAPSEAAPSAAPAETGRTRSPRRRPRRRRARPRPPTPLRRRPRGRPRGRRDGLRHVRRAGGAARAGGGDPGGRGRPPPEREEVAPAPDEPIIGAHGSGVTAPPDESVAEPEQAPGFETYVAPPPARPPTAEPPAPSRQRRRPRSPRRRRRRSPRARSPRPPPPAARAGGEPPTVGHGHAGGAQARARPAPLEPLDEPEPPRKPMREPRKERKPREPRNRGSRGGAQQGVPDRAGRRPRAGRGRGLRPRWLGRRRRRRRGRAEQRAGDAGRGRSRAGSRSRRATPRCRRRPRCRASSSPRARHTRRAARTAAAPSRSARPTRTTPRSCPRTSARRSASRAARCRSARRSSSAPTNCRRIATRGSSRRDRAVA